MGKNGEGEIRAPCLVHFLTAFSIHNNLTFQSLWFDEMVDRQKQNLLCQDEVLFSVYSNSRNVSSNWPHTYIWKAALPSASFFSVNRNLNLYTKLTDLNSHCIFCLHHCTSYIHLILQIEERDGKKNQKKWRHTWSPLVAWSPSSQWKWNFHFLWVMYVYQDITKNYPLRSPLITFKAAFTIHASTSAHKLIFVCWSSSRTNCTNEGQVFIIYLYSIKGSRTDSKLS